MQVLETVVFQEEGPARKTSAYASLQPGKRIFPLARQSENTSDLIIGVVRVAKRLWVGESAVHAVERLLVFPSQRIKDALQAGMIGSSARSCSASSSNTFASSHTPVIMAGYAAK